MAEATIGNWTESQFQKTLRDAIAQLLPDFIPGLTVDDLLVKGSLTLKGVAAFPRTLTFVGGSGAPPFTNSWVNSGGSNAPAAYWKDAFGVVTLEGTIKSGTVGSAAFTLPPGFRPDKDRFFPAYSNAVLGLVQVSSGGVVTPLVTGTASNASYSLDAIRFRTGKT